MSRPCLVCGRVTSGSRCPAHQRPRAAHRAAYNDPAYKAARKRLRGLPCIYCGRPSDTVEHVTPLAAGGANVEGNWAPACRPCNSRRGAKSHP